MSLCVEKPKRRFSSDVLLDQLFDRADFAGAGLRIGIAKKTVRCKPHPVAQAPTEDFGDGHAPRLTQNVQAGKLESREDLRPVVVERRGRIRDEEAHFFDSRRIPSDKIGLHDAENGFSRFAATTHLAQSDQPVIGFHFDNRTDKAAPMAAVRMTKRRLEWNRHGCRPDILDSHN